MIKSKLDLDIRIKYTDRILCGSDKEKYREALLTCKGMDRDYSGNQCTIGAAKNVTMDQY